MCTLKGKAGDSRHNNRFLLPKISRFGPGTYHWLPKLWLDMSQLHMIQRVLSRARAIWVTAAIRRRHRLLTYMYIFVVHARRPLFVTRQQQHRHRRFYFRGLVILLLPPAPVPGS